MPRLRGGAGAQSALAQAAGGVPPRSTSSGQLPESQVAPCGAASAVARPYGVPESGQTSHNGGGAGAKGISRQERQFARVRLPSRAFSEWATIRPLVRKLNTTASGWIYRLTCHLSPMGGSHQQPAIRPITIA